jgi:sec-independent protein translocase protein TatC
VGLVGGILVSSPYWFAQLRGFISPGLYSREKRIAIPVIGGCAGAFLLGAAFGYYLLPFTAAYFRSFQGDQVTALWSLNSYVNMGLQFMLAFGAVFELPLIIYAVAALGLVKPEHLRKYRRHSYVGILIVAAFITPGPDIFSQMVVAVPLLVLYEVGILMAVVAYRRYQRSLEGASS